VKQSEQIRRDTGVTFAAQCGAAGISYSSFMRWRARARRREEPVRRPGPGPVGFRDWDRLVADILALHHGRRRTRGTAALLERYRGRLSRREVTAWVRHVRQNLADEQAAETVHIEWKASGLVWAMDGVELTGLGGSDLQTVQDLGSRYKFPPLAADSLCGESIAGLLDGLFRRFGPPLFLKRDNGGNQNHQAVNDVLATYGVIPVNSPLAYPRYNGGIEHAQGEFQRVLADLARGHSVLPEEHLEAYAAAAAGQLNHQTRPCLGHRTACEVFNAGRTSTMIDRRERKEVTDELIVMAAGYLELADDWRLVTAMKAWRLAVETWLLAHQAISVSPNRVLPTFRPEKLS
jgi:transposase InsO family protein